MNPKVLKFPSKGKPPKQGRRFHFFHTWTKWEVIKEGPITYDGAISGRYKNLERECTVCGDKQSKMIKWSV